MSCHIMSCTFDGQFLQQMSSPLDEYHAFLDDLWSHEVHFPCDGAQGGDGVQGREGQRQQLQGRLCLENLQEKGRRGVRSSQIRWEKGYGC